MTKPTPATEVSRDYVWAFPGSPIRIHLALTVVSKLREQLFTGFDPGLAKEIGGLLLGRAQAGRVYITDVRSFNAADDGRYFVLSAPDKVRLQSLIQKQRDEAAADETLPIVVGYFRSDLRGGVRLSQEDLVLSKEIFNDPKQVFLIIGARDAGTPTAGFFFWDTGSIFAEGSFMQFPLDEKLLAIPRSPSVPKEPSAPAIEQNEPTSNIPHRRAAHSASSRWFLWTAGLLVLAIAGGTVVYRFSKPAPQQSTAVVTRPAFASPMALSAARTDQNVTITWDSTLPAIAEARIGVLTIKDGRSTTEFPLTQAQLQMRKIIYVTQAERLEFTLEVFSPDGKATRESMMLAVTQPPTKSRSRLESASVEFPKQQQQEIRTPVVENPQTSQRIFRATPSPPARNVTNPTVIFPDTPPPAQVAAFDPAGIKTPDFLSPLPVNQVAPKVTESIATVSRPVSLQPPVPMRQVRPVVPPNVSAMLKRRVDVQVRVSIDQTGKVIKAEPVVPPGGLNQYLGTSAANTARLWTFQPARRGSTPVMSDLVLNFTFGPANEQE